MAIHPSFSEFEACYKKGLNQVVYTLLAADLDTPVSLMLKLADARPYSFILESVTGGSNRGRYSIVGMDPDMIWQCRNGRIRISHKTADGEGEWIEEENEPLQSLRAFIAQSQIDLPKELPPSSAGLFGYLGYDMIRLVETLPEPRSDPLGLPDAVLFRPSIVAVHDSVKGDVTVVTPVWADSGLSVQDAYKQAVQRVKQAVHDVESKQINQHRVLDIVQETPARSVSNLTKEAFIDIVKRAKQYICDGDIFQVVPSQRWKQMFTLPPFSLYRALRRTNPSPFMFFINFNDFQVIGASPEILVRVLGKEVTLRPLAGTRPRGQNAVEDARLADDLLNDEKERAEHLMLLDLGRNDVGRVSRVGTVRPTETFVVEHYSHVMHIASHVVGELKDSEDALSALLSGLPAGTVSGAPKVRAMEIINELEPEKRGVYGGGVGYFSVNGDMDMCIALRTAVLKDDQLYIQAGSGIVYDSDPIIEWQETRDKAAALRRAVRDAAMFNSESDS